MFNPFETQQTSSHHGVSDINDIFGNSNGKNESKSNVQQNSNTNQFIGILIKLINHFKIDFPSFTNPQTVQQQNSAVRNTTNNNNLPFDLNFNLTSQPTGNNFKNANDMPSINSIPTGPTSTTTNQKLETDQLLKSKIK